MGEAEGVAARKGARVSKIESGARGKGEWDRGRVGPSWGWCADGCMTGSDTGVKAILKEVHDKIKTLETELTEMHKLMAADPEVGISVLLDRPRDPYSRDLRSASDDAPAWLDLIAKHKE